MSPRLGVTGFAVGDDPMLPARAVWQRFGICDRTLDRWLASPCLHFPKPTIINRRRYWSLSDIEGWAAQASRSRVRK